MSLILKKFLEAFFIADDDLVGLEVNELCALELVKVAGDGLARGAEALGDFFAGEGDKKHLSLRPFLGEHVEEKFDEALLDVLQGDFFNETAETPESFCEEPVQALREVGIISDHSDVIVSRKEPDGTRGDRLRGAHTMPHLRAGITGTGVAGAQGF